jgi:hypothetical protein
MLVVDPTQRITAKEVLAHPFLHVEEEAPAEIVANGSPVKSPAGVVTRVGTSGGNSKRSVNLNNALRLLSGHVNELRSEKFAMTFTRLVSSLEGQNKGSGQGSMLAQLVYPIGKASTITNNKPAKSAEEEMMMFQNPEIKGALAATIAALGDDQGRLSIEQFMYILKHFSLANGGTKIEEASTDDEGASTPATPLTPASTSSNYSHKGANPASGLALMLLCKFVDRDGDGMISAEDIFTTQALILQRSDVFLKVIFRLYCEAVWYPGRQLNFHQLQKTMAKQIPNPSGGSSAVLGGEVKYVDVVEPPKFITAKHVAATFERLGFDGAGGQKIFAALCEALARRRQGSSDGPDDSEMGSQSLMSRDSLGGNPVTPPSSSAPSNNPKSPNAAFALALGGMDDVPPTPPRKADSSSSITVGPDPSIPLPATPSALREGGYKPDGTAAKMDFNDFVRACEIDDVLINVLINNLRGGIINLIHKAEFQVAAMGAEAKEAQTEEQDTFSSDVGTTPRRSKSVTGRAMSTTSERLASNLINNELSAALREVGFTKKEHKAVFPVAAAVGNY